jgi:hypothetical protein
MKTRSLVCIGILVILLSACGPGGLKITSTSLPPGIDPSPTSLPQGDAESCLPGLPFPPATFNDPAATADYLNTITTLGGTLSWFDSGADFRVYTIMMAPDDLETF